MMFDLTDFEKGLGNFSDRVEIIVGLEMCDKLTSDEAYKMIKEEFKKLKKLRKEN